MILEDVIRYWRCNMTDSQRDQASKDPGVKTVEPLLRGGYAHHVPSRDMPPLPTPTDTFPNGKMKRDIKYVTQTFEKDVVTELVEVSQPSTVPDVKNLKNYVYESNGGQHSFIYHLENGVSFRKQPKEFPNVVDDKDHLQTDMAKSFGINPWEDPMQNSHGTCTAGKALGQGFGAAKKAKLVVVQIWEVDVDEMINAVKLILEDVTKTHPERRKKSVVTLSLYLEPGGAYPGSLEALWDAIALLTKADIPMFVAAGNFAQEPGREQVDTAPAIFAADDYPLVVVGSTDHGGALSPFSQRGSHVSIHATGNQITCMLRQGDEPATDKWGTSFSAPLVAGEAANLLSYDTVPFDTSDQNLVKNLRKYLQDKSWARPGGNIPMLWNGVTEKDNPKVDAQASTPSGPAPTATTPPPPPKSPEKQCRGLASSQYVSQTELADLIGNEFCKEVEKGIPDKNSGSIARHYNEGTSEFVSIAMDGPPGVPLKQTQDDCKKHFLELVDGCDGNDPSNPEDYKGGGTFFDGTFTYHIDPQTLRQPASKGKQGGCVGAYKALWNEYTVWGHGWDSADHGDAFKKELGGCAILPDTWDFQYGLGDDGREWTAKFRTGVFQKHCVGDAGKTASGIANFGCSGSG